MARNFRWSCRLPRGSRTAGRSTAALSATLPLGGTPEALDRLRRQHALILTQAEGIYGLDRLGHTTFVNTAASLLLGYDIDELLGQSMHQVLHHTRADGVLSS